MSTRAQGMGITTMHRNQHIGSKRRNQGRKQGIHHLDIRIILSKRLQRHIHGIATPAPIAGLQHIASTRKKITSRLMKGDSHYTWIVVKRTLNAIAMMSIEIDIEHF